MSKRKYLAMGPLPPPIGGDTVLFSRLLRSRLLQEAGIELEVIDTSRKEKESRLVRRLDVRDAQNAVRFLWRAIRLRPEVDGLLLWANNRFAYTLGLLLILLFSMRRKRVIIKLFGGDFAEEVARLPRWMQKLVKSLFSRVDYLLPETRGLCDFFRQRMGMAAEKVVHLPNFLPYQPPISVHRLPVAGLRTVFIGQIRTEKGVFDILEAVKRVPAMTCTFYGPIFAREQARFQQLLAEIPRAAYGGVLSPGEVVDKIAEYDLLLLPSYHPGEGYPAAILEAFFAGVPVIATAWRMIPELVQHEVNGFLVKPNCPAEIAACVEKILSEPQRYELLSDNARAAAEQYTEQAVIGDILLPLLDSGRAETLLYRVQPGEGGG
ncbi:glycosyltransferase family 4 protein [Brevibacillus fulvus]|uniref:Glycosyltransferase involved in cell wall biosynthesis n=1 Tax=Brevibacillus fulvus TaxID=1125967 RepID=A0A939BTW8_9BACL|nr:glycosyltransferase family 4 protein [Brevibacillus fulvus]MBM7588901.1 glycosyltransferase involved in cell wall biosynthesis [Brevibacillus fulvus]